MPEEVWTEERCWIAELVNDPAIPDFSLARCRVEPGVTTQLHRLTVREWYVVEAGRGMMRLGDNEPRPIAAGEIVEIPAGAAQQVTNTADTDLVFQCVCLPRFTPDCYESLE
ncbi:MAG: cupin domain-containing protein [Gammaproteobacteria bacterium]